jgi:hypothetical protein
MLISRLHPLQLEEKVFLHDRKKKFSFALCERNKQRERSTIVAMRKKIIKWLRGKVSECGCERRGGGGGGEV